MGLSRGGVAFVLETVVVAETPLCVYRVAFDYGSGLKVLGIQNLEYVSVACQVVGVLPMAMRGI